LRESSWRRRLPIPAFIFDHLADWQSIAELNKPDRWARLSPDTDHTFFLRSQVVADSVQVARPVDKIKYHPANQEMYDTVEEILHEAKAEVFDLQRGRTDLPGSAIHEHGTCRMGSDPKNSALNGFCQMHAVKNLFVVDGSAFSSASEKNPTLTILALAWRATDYLADEIKKGNL